MAIAQTCPLLVWLSIKHYQLDCVRKYEIMNVIGKQSVKCISRSSKSLS